MAGEFMKSGKISQAVYDRSVFRPLKRTGSLDSGVFYGADSAGCAAVSCGPVCGPFDPSIQMRIAEAVNNLAVDGADPAGCRIQTGITVPSGGSFSESALLDLVTEIGKCCAVWELTLAGGHTECSDAVLRPVLTVSASASRLRTSVPALPPAGGKDCGTSAGLYMAGRAGSAGSAVLAENFRDRLRERFPLSMIDAARISPEELLLFGKAARALENGAVCMKDVSRGGVFAALWEFSSKLQCGFEADLKKIPIRQETIEICEYFDLNPYQLYGQGAILAAVPEKGGETSPEERDFLLRAGFQRIGSLTAGKARIIRNGEEIRYLERPQQDALNVLAERSGPDLRQGGGRTGDKSSG